MIKSDELLHITARNIFDEDTNDRYSIYRSWNESKDKATIIMFNPARLNPNPFRLGQTLSGIVQQLEELNCGTVEVVNLCSSVSDKKKQLPRNKRRFDDTNFAYIKNAVESSDIVVLFWGNDNIVSKHKKFIEMIRRNDDKTYCFRITKNLHPDYIYGLSLKSHKLQRCIMSEDGEVELIK